MNDTQATTYLQALLSTLTINVIVPLAALMMLFGLFVWVLWRAQRNPEFDVSEFLRDENEKLSGSRAFAFVCLGVHTWALMTEAINARMTHDLFMAYGLTWSGSMVLFEAAKKWDGRLPLSGRGEASGGAEK